MRIPALGALDRSFFLVLLLRFTATGPYGEGEEGIDAVGDLTELSLRYREIRGISMPGQNSHASG